jgi:hypothetical protein
MLHEIAPGSASGQGHAVLQTAADITRLIRRLFIRLEVPRIEVNLRALPALHVQHTQQRLDHLRDHAIGWLGEVAAGVTLFLGFAYAWARDWKWQKLGIILMAVGAAWLAGRALEAVWGRLRLIWALWRLRRQLVTGKGLYGGSTRALADPAYDSATLQAAPSPAAMSRRLGRADAGVAKPLPEPVRIALARDIAPVVGRVLLPWRLPRIELVASEQPALEMQRTQQRITWLSTSCNCVLGALLVLGTLLGAGFYIVLSNSRDWDWYKGYWDSRPGMLLAVAVVGAGIVGWLVETMFNRLRLAAVLLALRGRLRAQEVRGNRSGVA